MENPTLAERLKHLKCCVLIPTFNNEKTLKKIIDDVLKITPNLLVVNDGSTDSTAKILLDYSSINQLTISKNQGKGNALRLGFKKLESLGYHFAITVDSDGQHFPEDIIVFIEALENLENRNVILIGARNMTTSNVPKKSSFGNKFSNFWFWVETGLKLSDTQSGFRLYPLKSLKKFRFFTKKFEFEIEVIVKAAWSGITVLNVPIGIHYDQEERVSHFRPFQDFTRISVLNTYLVLLTFFYIKPRNIIRRFRKKGLKKFMVEDFLSYKDAPEKKAMSVALGIFIGLSPIWGFHTIAVLFLAVFFNLNKVIAFTFSHISFPPFLPFVIFASLYVGNFILGENTELGLSNSFEGFHIFNNIKSYLVGSILLSIAGALISGMISFVIFAFLAKKRQLKNG